MRSVKASTCTSCTVPLKPLVGHCHLRLRCAIARNVSRSKAASPETGWNLYNDVSPCRSFVLLQKASLTVQTPK